MLQSDRQKRGLEIVEDLAGGFPERRVHDAQIDGDGLEAMRSPIVGQLVLEGTCGCVVGLAFVAEDAGTGGENDEEVRLVLVLDNLPDSRYDPSPEGQFFAMRSLFPGRLF